MMSACGCTVIAVAGVWKRSPDAQVPPDAHQQPTAASASAVNAKFVAQQQLLQQLSLPFVITSSSSSCEPEHDILTDPRHSCSWITSNPLFLVQSFSLFFIFCILVVVAFCGTQKNLPSFIPIFSEWMQ
jgi:hypothetical protein